MYNQIYYGGIIIQQPQSYAISLISNQFQQYPLPRKTRSKKKTNPANKAIPNGQQSEAQRTALKAGLEKSLDASNKGFEMLKKMGYEAGKPLGKDGCGIVEPISIPIKENPRDRAGLGQELKTVPAKKEQTTSEVKSSKPTTSTTKNKKTTKSLPVTKKEKRIQQLQIEYHEDIELLRLRLQVELSVKTKKTNSLIVAHVAITGEPICDNFFEIIYQYLINSLRVYKGNPFPMFHDIVHVNDEIKIICEDQSSFEYLSSCIAALSVSSSMPITTTRTSPVGSNVYLFSVQIPGLVNANQSFLMLIQKHRYDIKPDRWIVVTQQQCPKSNKTNLQIIVDEHSALLLIYRHSLRLFVCMQEIDFALRGVIPFNNK